MDVLGSCDETAAWAFDYLQKPLGLDRFYDKLGAVAMRLHASPTVNGVGEALSRLALYGSLNWTKTLRPIHVGCAIVDFWMRRICMNM